MYIYIEEYHILFVICRYVSVIILGAFLIGISVFLYKCRKKLNSCCLYKRKYTLQIFKNWASYLKKKWGGGSKIYKKNQITSEFKKKDAIDIVKIGVVNIYSKFLSKKLVDPVL